MSAIAAGRLREERKSWRKDHPPKFWARPTKKADGSFNLFLWKAGIPGAEGTPWEGGVYTVEIRFVDGYPSHPPEVKFSPLIFHPNIYPSGKVCLSILNAGQDWKPSITLKQILLGVQELLNNPNNNSPAQHEASQLLRKSPALYIKRIKEQAIKFTPSE